MKIRKQDLTNEESIYLTTYQEKASYFRGRLIDVSISVEMKLAEIFTNFFNHDEIKRKFMYSMGGNISTKYLGRLKNSKEKCFK